MYNKKSLLEKDSIKNEKKMKKEKQHDEECSCGHDHGHENHSNADRENEMQAKILEINVMENRLRQLEQSLNIIDQQIMEQQMLQLNIDELKKVKKGQDMLFPLGRNLFVKGKLEDNELLINIGNGIVVKKEGEKAKDIVERQKLQLVGIREEIAREVERILNEISLIERSLKM